MLDGINVQFIRTRSIISLIIEYYSSIFFYDVISRKSRTIRRGSVDEIVDDINDTLSSSLGKYIRDIVNYYSYSFRNHLIGFLIVISSI